MVVTYIDISNGMMEQAHLKKKINSIYLRAMGILFTSDECKVIYMENVHNQLLVRISTRIQLCFITITKMHEVVENYW